MSPLGLLCAALLGAVCTAAAASAGELILAEDSKLAAAVESIVTTAQSKSSIPGVSVAVARGDEIVVARGYGLADVENDVKVTPDTVFRIGSVTKQFTAAAILRLAEQGKLGLDDEITKHVPAFDPHGHKVTLRHLLTHTSGVKNYTELDDVMRNTALDVTPDELMERFEREPFDFEPGTLFHYSNSGYFLLGMTIEEVTGQPYDAVMRTFFFEPLGLEHTFAGDDVGIVKGRAQGYRHVQGKLANDEAISLTVPFAAGDLLSTASDLVKWNRELIGGGVVNGSSYLAMTTPQTLTNGNRTQYGFGLAPGEYRGHPVIAHAGGINGFTSQLSWYPEDDVTIAVLCNADDADPSAIERAIADVVIDG